MKKLFLLNLAVVVSLLGVSQELLAQSSKTKVDNKAKTGKKSEEITDALTKIQQGSASTWSIQTGLSYSGGNLSNPFGDERPDIFGSGIFSETFLGANISLVRRLDPQTTLNISTGFGWNTPVSALSNPSLDLITGIEPSTPGVAISRAGRVGEWQGYSSLSLDVSATAREKKFNHIGSLGFGTGGVRRIGGKTSPWKFRYGVSASFRFYGSKTGNATERIFECRSSKTDFAPCQVPFSISMFPILSYDMSDKVFIRTVFGVRALRYQQFGDSSSLTNARTNYQSLGVGIFASDSVYLYPNLQFDPTNIVLDNTNVAISATINMF